MNILISIHPEYAAMIYDGRKKIEFRTNIPRKYELCEDYIFLYETAPIFAVTGWMKVSGYINVNKIFSGDRKDLKKMIVNDGCMTIEQIKAYKQNLQLWGWQIKEFHCWGRNEYITRFSPSEKPPQSWCYTKADLQSPICFKFDHVLTKKTYEREKEILSKWEKNKGGEKCLL
jgi:predicted transcriptional regulator